MTDREATKTLSTAYEDIDPKVMAQAKRLHEDMTCPHGIGTAPLDDLDIAAVLIVKALEPVAEGRRRVVIDEASRRREDD